MMSVGGVGVRRGCKGCVHTLVPIRSLGGRLGMSVTQIVTQDGINSNVTDTHSGCRLRLMTGDGCESDVNETRKHVLVQSI